MRPTTPTGRLLAMSATVALSVALLAGCGDDNDDPETAPPDSQSSSSESSGPSTQPTSPDTTEPVTENDKAAADAEVVVRDYIGFVDELVADTSVDLGRLDAFLQNPELSEQRDYFGRFREQGFYSNGGSATLEWIRPTKVRVNINTGKAEVTLRACRNYDDVDVRFKDGDEVETLSPSLGIYQVFNYDYPNPTGWKIAIEASPGKGCRP